MSNENFEDDITRQLFLSSVCTQFASTAAILTGVPQMTNAVQPNTAGSGIDKNFSSSEATRPIARTLSVPLRSLPVSGCWGATITVSKNLESNDDNDFFTYLAVVDTGSPFLTAPMGALPYTQNIAAASTSSKVKNNQRRKQASSSEKASEMNISYEQYGTTIGSVQWRMAPYVTLIGTGNAENIQSSITSNRDNSIETEIEPIVIQDQTNVVLGVPSKEVVEETGGIFLGLMTVDAERPTPLEQLGYDAFLIRFRDRQNEDRSTRTQKMKDAINSDSQPTLVLWNGKQSDSSNQNSQIVPPTLINRFDPYSMKLFDLTPYGPNLHHYGVLCDRFECWWDGKEHFHSLSFDCDVDNDVNICSSTRQPLPAITLSRPLVAVFDTGLSGCIFSDTLWDEIQQERRRLKQYRKNESSDADSGGSNSEEFPPIGCTVSLPMIGDARSSSPPSVTKLSSISKYWRFQTFRLPWWYDEKDLTENDGKIKKSNFPHVVVLGSTFWRNPNVLELAVDTTSQRAKLKTVT